MLDVLNLPKPQNGYIDYFSGDAPTVGITSTSWRTWEKPRGISMIHITCFGGGQGGGGGISVAQQGGNGGGSGGQTTLLIPAHVLPDVLYVSPGKGGAGATVFGVTRGDAGTASYVSIAPSTAAIYVACFANGGGASGGTGGVVASQTSALMSFQGFFFALAGQNGASNVSYPTTGLLLSGGADGGPGGSFTSTGFGGNITAPTQASIRFFSNVPGSADGTGIPGSNGISLFQPLLSTGGAGGGGRGATANALNGSGGNGGFGSGGGGVGNAGGFINAGTSGGNGGDGLVIIQCF
jgi:hypothetical protein